MTPGERSHQPREPETLEARNGSRHRLDRRRRQRQELGGGLVRRARVRRDRCRLGRPRVLDLPAVQERLVNRFGPGCVGPGFRDLPAPVDRKALAAIVFADPEARQALEAIVHPLMRARFLEGSSEAGPGLPGARSCSTPQSCARPAGMISAIWSCSSTRLVPNGFAARPETADGPTQVSTARERAQWPCERKQLRADFVIRNDAGLDSLGREVERSSTLAGPAAAVPRRRPPYNRSPDAQRRRPPLQGWNGLRRLA